MLTVRGKLLGLVGGSYAVTTSSAALGAELNVRALVSPSHIHIKKMLRLRTVRWLAEPFAQLCGGSQSHARSTRRAPISASSEQSILCAPSRVAAIFAVAAAVALCDVSAAGEAMMRGSHS